MADTTLFPGEAPHPRRPADTPILDRLPPALVSDLRQVADRGSPFSGRSLQDVVTDALPLLEQLEHLGATGSELSAVLAELGFGASNGVPHPRSTVSKAMSRARKAWASGRVRQFAAACGSVRQEAASTGTLRPDAAGSVNPWLTAASTGMERHEPALSGIPRPPSQPEANQSGLNVVVAQARARFQSLHQEDDA